MSPGGGGVLTPQVGMVMPVVQLVVCWEAVPAAARWAARRIRTVFMVSLKYFPMNFPLEI